MLMLGACLAWAGAAGTTVRAQPPKLFVVDASTSSLRVIDVTSNSVTASIPLGSQPGDPVRSVDGGLVYVPNRGSNSISVIDTATEMLLTTLSHGSFSEPVALAPTPNGRELWVLNRKGGAGLGSISIVDTASNAVTAVLTQPSFNLPQHLAINPVGSRTYVVNTAAGTVSVLLTTTRRGLLTVDVGGTPLFAAVSSDSSEVYVAREGDSTLARIRTRNHTVSGLLLSGSPGRMSARGDLLLVALDSPQLAIVNTRNGSLSFLPISGAGARSFSPAFIEGASRAYLTDSGLNRIRAVDLRGPAELQDPSLPITAVAQPRGIVSTGALATVDLSLTKEADTTSPLNGLEVDFAMEVRNAGPSVASQVLLSDPLVPGMQFVSATATQGSCSLNATTVECNLGALAVGAVAAVTLRVRVSREGTLTNTAEVTAAETDSNPVDNAASAMVTVTPAADLQVAASAQPDPVAVGQQLTYGVDVRNLGASLARNASLTVRFPAGIEFVSTDIPEGVNCQGNDRNVICNLSAVVAGGNRRITIRVIPRLPGTILVSVQAQSSTFDLNPEDNTLFVETTVSAMLNSSDLVMSKTVQPAVGRRGGQVVYGLEVRNQGPDASSDAIVVESLPEALQFTGFTNPFGSCTTGEDGLACRMGDLGVGQSKFLQLSFVVPAQARGLIVNRALVRGPGVDPEPANDEAVAELLVAGSADFNLDGVIDAGDLQVLILELTDGDGESVDAVGGGSFIGNPEMDLNYDGRITRADVAVVIRLIFAGTP